jgi:hypothetical protein
MPLYRGLRQGGIFRFAVMLYLCGVSHQCSCNPERSSERVPIVLSTRAVSDTCLGPRCKAAISTSQKANLCDQKEFPGGLRCCQLGQLRGCWGIW